MFAFGLPRALLGPGPLTDARVAVTAVAAGAALLALLLAGGSGSQRLRAVTVLLVLPSGARYLAGGGDDVAVAALLLLGMVLEHRRRPVAAGVVVGLAAAVKQTAWLPLPFLALAARDRHGGRAGGRLLAAAAAVVGSLVAPFAAWNAHRLVESVVLYPLALAGEPTIARGPTLGRGLAAAFPPARGLIAAALAVALAGVAAWLLLRHPPASVQAAAEQASLVLTLAVLFATAGRPGYLIYPLDLLVWSRLLRAGEPRVAAAPGGGAGGGARAGRPRRERPDGRFRGPRRPGVRCRVRAGAAGSRRRALRRPPSAGSP